CFVPLRMRLPLLRRQREGEPPATVPKSGRCLGNTSRAADKPITPGRKKKLHAERTYLQAVVANPHLEADDRAAFKRELAIQVLAAPLIWNCLTAKHPAYAHEREVRLILPGVPTRLAPYITTRLRVNELVPYVVHHLPRRPHNFGAIVTGPATSPDSVR